MGLSLSVTAEAERSPAQRAVHDELDPEHVGDEVAVDRPMHQIPEVRCDSFRGDLRNECGVGVGVVGEEGDVADVALVAGARTADVAESDPRHHLTASTSTRCDCSTAWRSTKNGSTRSSGAGPARARERRPMPWSPAGLN